MYPYLGDFEAGKTIFFPFHTFNSSGASVTITGLAVTDIEVYKGASMTQRSSDAGYALVDTDGIDLDSITGIHGITIDTSDNTDAGFYAAGNDYTVVVSSVTVDSQTVNFILGRFSISNRAGLKPTVEGRTLDVASTGEAGIDLNNINLPVGAIPAFGIIDNGTAQSATGTTLVLRSAAAFADDTVIGATLMAFGSTQGYWQTRTVTDAVLSTDTLTVDTWTVTPSGTITYILFAGAPASATLTPTVTLADNGITAAKIATDAFTAAKFAADVTTELQSGLATASSISTLQTSVNTIDDFLDTEIAAIKTKTDFLPSATAGSAGGVMIAGSNAATTFATLTISGATTYTGNVSMAAGLNITQTTADTAALNITGNGAANGATITSGSGATGAALRLVAASTNGSAFSAAGSGSGSGISAAGGATGNAITGLGGGSGAGFSMQGGPTGVGARFIGGATSGAAVALTTTSGDGMQITPTAGHALVLTANGTSKHGLVATGGTAGVSDGVKFVAGSGGVDLRGDITANAMVESYAADGAAPTLAQALFLIMQSIGEVSVSGTTMTIKGLDGTTTVATYTLDDATTPTSRTRAS